MYYFPIPVSENVIHLFCIVNKLYSHCSSYNYHSCKESTTMAIIGERWGLFPLLKQWVSEKKPIWGTCAGMILLSDHAIKKAKCGQVLVGGLDVHVCRNFFGSQIHSCQVQITIDPSSSGEISVPGSGFDNEDVTKCPAVFIRAPAILSIGPDIDILARIIAKPHISARNEVMKLLNEGKSNENTVAAIIESINEMMIDSDPPKNKRRRISKNIVDSDNSHDMSNENSINIVENSFEVFVAVRQGDILATAFHPELTEDLRWHK